MYNTRMITTNPQIHRVAKYVSVLYNLDNKNEIIGMPYDIILVGKQAISTAITYIKETPEISSQILGAFCKDENEKILAKSIHSNIHIGDKDSFGSISDFVRSINPKLEIWDKRNAIPKLHVLVQVWKHSNPERLRELQVCMLKNVQNPLIHKIHVSLDGENAYEALSEIPIQYMNKIVYAPITNRLTFKDALQYMSNLPTNDFAALINSDIYFDHTIREIWNIRMKNTCVALLRHESNINYALGVSNANKPTIFGPRNDSQDAWIFAVNELLDHKGRESWDDLNFCLGMPGCDNSFAGELLRRKWNNINPALSIYALHLHQTQIREYDNSKLVSKFLYHLIAPSAILPSQ